MNREARFPQKREEIPGPGAYTIPDKENKPQIGQIKVMMKIFYFYKFWNKTVLIDFKVFLKSSIDGFKMST